MSALGGGAPVDPLLIEQEGHVGLLLGNEAIVRGALESGVAFASGYPGTPSSEVTDSFARIAESRGIGFEYSVNEKIALEMAYAASLAGGRSICAMKHLGLLVAGDPLSTIPYMGVRAGMVIVSAGDPSCHTSPNEQDQRHLGPMLHVPVLDPSTPRDALAMTRMAFELSEKSLLPVLLRITARVAHCRAPVKFGQLVSPTVTGFERNPARFVPIPPHARKLRSEIPARLEVAREFTTQLFRREGTSSDGPKQAVVATGSPAATCRDLIAAQGVADRLVFAEVGGVYPLPEEPLVALLREVDRVLVVEELSPFLEDALHILCSRHGIACEVLGKRSGHLPEPFEYTSEIIEGGLRGALELVPAAPVPSVAMDLAGDSVAMRPAVLCSGCPHRATYFAARSAFGEDQLYFNDIGCYTLGFAPPLKTADALLCMGAGFTLAAGVSRLTGQRTVGFMGDGTFFHAGMPALLNAVKADANMVAVILDNQVVAMTGFQESPTVSIDAPSPTRSVSIEGVVRALGVEHVETIDPERLPTAIAAFERARDHEGLYVIIAEHPCPVHMARVHGAPDEVSTFAIDPSQCQTCARESCGLRCDQGVTPGLERHMAKSRALEVITDAHAGPARDNAAPCGTQCPLALCIQGYSGHIASGQYEHALELIMSRNPLPDSVCRVCHRPCEAVCVRAQIDEPVAINDLKRFVLDWAATTADVAYQPKCEEPHGRRVAVIGSGPAGLAAAHDLRLRGYEVCVYDRAEQPGGLLRTGVPAFRLPREALDRDVARILGMGVRFEGNRALGRDITLRGLLGGDSGYQAVFLAIGAGRSQALEWAGGSESLRVDGALDYLARARAEGSAQTGKRVVVIGGGNAALDAARTALRCGAEKVVVACREGRGEMPALADEIAGALEEGVEVQAGLSPRLTAAPTGAIAFFPVASRAGAGDEALIFEPDVGDDVQIEADHVIVAVGQMPELGMLEGDLSLDRTGDGSVRVDLETMQSSHPGVFAGGDAAGGRRSVTDSIADGQRAAWGIDRSLRGGEAADHRTPPPRTEPCSAAKGALSFTRGDARPRAQPVELDPAERRGGFVEVASTLTEKQARAEAARCMVCGQCGNCRACIDLFGCPAFHMVGHGIEIDPEICTGCGECADFCPNRAIHKAPPTKLGPAR